jgi:hypothetical protein
MELQYDWQQPTLKEIKRAGIMVTLKWLVTEFLSSNGHLKIPEWAVVESCLYDISEMNVVAQGRWTQ